MPPIFESIGWERAASISENRSNSPSGAFNFVRDFIISSFIFSNSNVLENEQHLVIYHSNVDTRYSFISDQSI
ncbi:unnamed protein product [Adineta ricciae]|uniref:Uncharacterized protein n=1 Tax=Adineta ricciae TaxID=249248 RepID=A0A814MLG2_ADIRI|nr:unnamed protein product [Adineta ricciae]